MGINYKTKGDVKITDEPKVYFCCHQDEHKLYFDGILEELFSVEGIDCAVFFYEDGKDENENWRDVIQSMNLLVVIVTRKFLNKDSQAKKEFLFALEHRIPVLPILKEAYLVERFNEIAKGVQAIQVSGVKDVTEISYKDKMNTFLTDVLMKNELISRIHKVSEGHIFFSYRKKDRKYLLELIEKIREDEKFIDIPIWYDEFLVMGEEFNKQIEEKLLSGKAFVLSVTPNLLEEGNYVLKEEYPKAVKNNKPIIPIEMVDTDKTILKDQYEKLSDCIHRDDQETISKALEEVGFEKQEDSLERDFLIGMGYLTGTDREKNIKLAMKKIVDVANKGYEEAIRKLIHMYEYGDGVEIHFGEAIKWQNDLLKLMEETCNLKEYTNSAEFLYQLLRLGDLYVKDRMLEEAIETYEKVIKSVKDNSELLYFQISAQDRLNELNSKGVLKLREKDLEGAEKELDKKYRKCVKKNKTGNTWKIITELYEIAEAYREINAVKKAKEAYKQAYARLHVLDKNFIVNNYFDISINILQKQGDLNILMGDYKDAEVGLLNAKKFSEKQLKKMRDKNALESMWISYEKLADFYRECCRNEEGFRKALQNIEESITYGEELAENGNVEYYRAMGEGYRRKGGLHEELNECDAAMDAYMKAKEIFEKMPEEHIVRELEIATVYDDMGDVCLKRMYLENEESYYQSAAGYYEDAFEIRNTLMNKEGISDDDKEKVYEAITFTYDNLGRMGLRDINDKRGLEMALHFLEKNKEICEELHQKDPYSLTRMYHLFKAYFRIADAHIKSAVGDKKRAREFFDEANEFAKRTGINKHGYVAMDIEKMNAFFKNCGELSTPA